MRFTKRQTFMASAVAEAEKLGWVKIGDPFTVNGDLSGQIFQRMSKTEVMDIDRVITLEDTLKTLHARVDGLEDEVANIRRHLVL